MRTWVYEYKTSDGLRHEAEMIAPSKDAVYTALREKGIRAIRVNERVVPVVRRGFRGLRKRDWALVATLAFLVSAVGSYFFLRMESTGEAPSATMVVLKARAAHSAQYASLTRSVDAAMSNFRRMYAGIDRELLANYGLLLRSENEERFEREGERGLQVVERARLKIRAIYLEQYQRIPAEALEDRDDAQRLYGIVMDEVDAAAECLEGELYVVRLLCRNRGKWNVEGGEVRWTDDALDNEFRSFRLFGEPTVSTRFRRDFEKHPRRNDGNDEIRIGKEK